MTRPWSTDEPSREVFHHMQRIRWRRAAGLYVTSDGGLSQAAYVPAPGTAELGSRHIAEREAAKDLWRIDVTPGGAQLFFGGLALANGTTVQYMALDKRGGTWFTSADRRNIYMPVAGKISLGRIVLSGTPGSGKSYTFDVLKNGVVAMTIAIADLATAGEDLSTVIDVVPGDVVVIRKTPSGTPTSRKVFFTFKFQSAAALMVCAADNGGQSPSTSATSYNALGTLLNGWPSTVPETDNVWAIDATMSVFRVDLSVAPGSGKSRAFTLMKNGVAETSSTVTISGAATSGESAFSIATALGDRWAVRSVPSGSPAAATANYGVAYRPAVAGQWNLAGVTSRVTPDDPAYEWPYGDLNWESEATALRPFVVGGASAPRVVALAWDVDTAPVVAATLELEKNGAGSGLAITLTNPATTGAASGDIAYTDADTITLRNDGGEFMDKERWSLVLTL